MSQARRNGSRQITEIEIQRKLGLAQEILAYQFSNTEYLLQALTHPSAAETNTIHNSYERMEFLGDSYLDAIIAEELFARFPDLDEGGLTRIKVSVVSGESLSKVAQELGFADAIIFGGSERGTGQRGLHSALENVFEAVVAALILDGGIDLGRQWVLKVLGPYISIEHALEPENPKSTLQELCQAKHSIPSYRLVSQDGPPHDRTFTCEVLIANQVVGQGSGRSKKEAESNAAKQALKNLE